MSGTTCVGLCSRRDEIRYSISLSRFQFSIIPERDQLRIGDMLNAFEVVSKLIPQLIDSANNRLDRSQQRIVGFILFAADVLVLRQVLAMSVISSGIAPGRLVHTIMVVV